MKPRLHAARNAVIRAAYAAGVSQKELAGRYRLSRQAISLVVIDKRLPPSKKQTPIVSAELAAAIRDEYATGRISLAKLVARHHLTIHHINQALGKRVPGRGKRRQLFLSAV
jgi:transcriptional regulator with XRE-family HTH domain